jgi:CNT family concentrative nucleoside transporter
MKKNPCLQLLFFFLLPVLLFSQTPDAPETILNSVDSTVLNDIAEEQLNSAIPNEGFSFHSLWRGILGMLVLIGLAFLFSSNRKAINWKTVGIGLAIQLA